MAQSSKENSQRPISAYAVNLHGWAMKDGRENRTFPEVIRAQYPALFSSKLATLRQRIGVKSCDPKYYRDTLTFTAAERDIDNCDDIKIGNVPKTTAKYLIVGYTTVVIAEQMEEKKNRHMYAKDAPSKKKQSPIGVEEPPPEGLVEWCEDVNSPDTMVLYVVVPLVETTRPSQGPNFYALVLPEPATGICQAWKINQTMVFYRHEFRDTSTDNSKRPANWGRIITGVSNGVINDARSGKGLPRIKRMEDLGCLNSSTEESLISTLETLYAAASHDESTHSFVFKEMKDALERACPDLASQPELPDHSALRDFCEPPNHDSEDCGWTTEKAEEVAKSVQQMWPHIEHVNAASILELKKTLDEHVNARAGQERLGYYYIDGFIADGCYLLATSLENWKEYSATQKQFIIGGIIDRVIRIKGPVPAESPAVIWPQEQRTLLASMLTALKRALKNYDRHVKKLRDSYGDATLGNLGPLDGWQTFSKQPDTDSARLAFLQNVKWSLAFLRDRTDALLYGPVSKIVELLEKVDLTSDEGTKE